MSRLFQRQVQLVTGSLDVSNLRVTFHVEKTIKPIPNKAVIHIHNLSEKHQNELESGVSLPVRLNAGYKGAALHQIYFGEVRAAYTKINKGECVTVLETGDAEQARAARLHVPLGPKGDLETALNQVVKALGVKPGNLPLALKALKLDGKYTFKFSGVISGNASQNMTDFCRSAGLEWSIQDGAIQILTLGDPVNPRSTLLNSNTGLIESPTITLDKKVAKLKGEKRIKTGKPVVTAKVLIQPGLNPGNVVVFDSAGVQGAYRVEKTTYVGDTHGPDWHAQIDCVRW